MRNDRRQEIVEKKFKHLVDNLGDAAYETDASGNLTYVNKAAETLTGVPIHRLIGNPFMPLFEEESQRIAKDMYRKALQGERLEFELTFTNGKTARFKNEPLLSTDGKIIGTFGVARDITRRKKIRAALEESEEKYRAIAEYSTVGFWQSDPDGRTLYINPAMCRMLETDRPEEFLGKTYQAFCDPANQKIVANELIKRLNGQSSTYEIEIIGTKGNKRNVMVCGAPILLSDGQLHSNIGTLTDITELKKKEKALKKSRTGLENRVEERTADLRKALREIQKREKTLARRKLELEAMNKELLETNQAMSVLARNIDYKKEAFQKKIFEICASKVMPILKSVQKDARFQKQRTELDLAISFINDLHRELPPVQEFYHHLTDQEMRVVMMIKNGLTSQQIADVLCLSLYTIKTHRKNIRKKLNINNTDINLATYLKSKLESIKE